LPLRFLYPQLPATDSEQLHRARQPDGDPIPQEAKARIERLLNRLDLVLKLIEQVESARDAVLKKIAPADEAERRASQNPSRPSLMGRYHPSNLPT
jgi:hypothetical protein